MCHPTGVIQLTAVPVFVFYANANIDMLRNPSIQTAQDENILPLFANLVPFKIKRGQQKSGRHATAMSNFTLVNGEHYVFS